jgi:hypothetical protein
VELPGVGRIIAQQVSEEGSQCGKPCIARCSSILTNLLQVAQEADDMIRVKIFDSQVGYGPTFGQVAEEQLERVAVCPNGVRTGRSHALQILLKEGLDQCRKRIGVM